MSLLWFMSNQDVLLITVASMGLISLDVKSLYKHCFKVSLLSFTSLSSPLKTGQTFNHILNIVPYTAAGRLNRITSVTEHLDTLLSQFQDEKFYFNNMSQKSWIVSDMRRDGLAAHDHFWHQVWIKRSRLLEIWNFCAFHFRFNIITKITSDWSYTSETSTTLSVYNHKNRADDLMWY